jgi:putative transcriptional regulator
VFVELPPFERYRAEYLDDAAFSSLQAAQGVEGTARVGSSLAETTMKSGEKKKRKTVSRDLFGELVEGMHALVEAREGKRTLRTHPVEFKPAPVLMPADLIRIRKRLRLSRGLFATFLRTNPRTLENWEQGRARPNPQAALLISLVQKFPDMVDRLANV